MAERVQLVPYDPRWPGLFEVERGRLAASAAIAAVTIEHVGSTAVPGMPAKPVIDILVELATYPPTPACVAALIELGYEPMGEAGVPGRHWFRKGTPRTHHIHAVPVGRIVGRRQRAFRDWLRAHPADARRYAELKRSAANEYPDDLDGADYARAKSALIEQILTQAMPA